MNLEGGGGGEGAHILGKGCDGLEIPEFDAGQSTEALGGLAFCFCLEF